MKNSNNSRGASQQGRQASEQASRKGTRTREGKAGSAEVQKKKEKASSRPGVENKKKKSKREKKIFPHIAICGDIRDKKGREAGCLGGGGGSGGGCAWCLGESHFAC